MSYIGNAKNRIANTMTRWEYIKIDRYGSSWWYLYGAISARRHATANTIEGQREEFWTYCNQLGNEGWELVGYSSEEKSDREHLIFKRQRTFVSQPSSAEQTGLEPGLGS